VWNDQKTPYLCGIRKVEEILNKILLPLNSSWQISDVQIKEPEEEIYVCLNYDLPYIDVNGRRYNIYDHRPVRQWRHLDLWQYKTYITARLPRYRDEHDFYHTVDIPWADTGEQMTILLKKK
jgi:hypothetical protein